jgi:hypothetical protein
VPIGRSLGDGVACAALGETTVEGDATAPWGVELVQPAKKIAIIAAPVALITN